MIDDASPEKRPRRLAWYERLLLGTLGTMLLILLTTASNLTPSQQGLGTHQQLGLPPCSFKSLFGMRCPSCGMTTSWTYLMNVNLIGSMKANSAGCVLGVISLIVSPWSLLSAIKGTWAAGPPSENWLLGITIAVVLLTIADWLFRIW